MLFTESASTGETLKSLERELQALIDSTKSSVVSVTARFSREIMVEDEPGLLSMFKEQVNKTPYTYSNIGTGVIFDSAGHVITRISVVAGAVESFITVADGRRFQAKFVGQDPATGFAVLKIDAGQVEPIVLAPTKEIPFGTFSLIIGNSLGVYPSVAIGVVNGLRDDGLLQISAGLSPGNNGSPVINLDGETIGLLAGQLNMTSGGSTESRVNLNNNATTIAYPASWIKHIAEEIIGSGYVRKGWLGVVGHPDGRRPKIREIRNNSPAQRAGLKAGDIITRFSHKKVRSIAGLARFVEFTRPGAHVTLEYIRGSQILKTSVQIGEKPVPEISVESPASTTGADRTDDKLKQVFEELDEQTQKRPQEISLERRISRLEMELSELRRLVNKQTR